MSTTDKPTLHRTVSELSLSVHSRKSGDKKGGGGSRRSSTNSVTSRSNAGSRKHSARSTIAAKQGAKVSLQFNNLLMKTWFIVSMVTKLR